MSLNDKALEYYAKGRPGKIRVVPTKDCVTAADLSLAYSPGVAALCLEIEKDPEDTYKYTAKRNLVAVISNGTAVLGLGNSGALAGKPVMEGKGVLFKRFADIVVFDIEVDTEDVEEMIKFCDLTSPAVDDISILDIRVYECFEIGDRVNESLELRVIHDDHYETATIPEGPVLNDLPRSGLVTQDTVKSIAAWPPVFAMASPDSEMPPVDANQGRPYAISATDHSDYANQLNNEPVRRPPETEAVHQSVEPGGREAPLRPCCAREFGRVALIGRSNSLEMEVAA